MPRKGDGLMCRHCGVICLKSYPGPVTDGSWVWVTDRPEYALCGNCHRAQTERIVGSR